MCLCVCLSLFLCAYVSDYLFASFGLRVFVFVFLSLSLSVPMCLAVRLPVFVHVCFCLSHCARASVRLFPYLRGFWKTFSSSFSDFGNRPVNYLRF